MTTELKGLDVYSQDGSKQGSIEVDISSVNLASDSLISDVAVMYMANQKNHTACVKGRSDIARSKRKQRKQKGLGRARAGHASSPIWVGGGVAFGPRPRVVRYSVPKKMKLKALKAAFFKKIADDGVMVMDALKVDAPKTKAVAEVLKKLSLDKVTIVYSDRDDNLLLSARNIPGVKLCAAKDLNLLNVIASGKLLFIKEAFEQVKEKLTA